MALIELPTQTFQEAFVGFWTGISHPHTMIFLFDFHFERVFLQGVFFSVIKFVQCNSKSVSTFL